TLYAGKGCAVCNSTGYNGRTAVFEFIRVTPELQDLILKRPSSREIWELAAKQGLRTMFEDGLEKVRLGTTTLEELLRVVEVPDAPSPEKV
ncbi:MAG: type II secretion system protein GspE, partial [Candidatus Andersenbacteria bacterium]|nr:type II secretion system protein GspE [Candidatus Andersenbacteria bacterium]